jgi:arylsulfatase A-like enzyme
LFVKLLLPFRGLYRTFAFVGALLAIVTGVAKAQNTCGLNSPKGKIKHVIYVQFDNTHFVRDNPNVPSDLEQMPSLLNFLEGQGTLLTNHHTPLISHTATDILTSLTGVYGDRHGVPVANSFRYFNPDGTSNLGVSFAYWTDPIFDPTTSTPTDTKFNMLTADGHNAPAPWVAFTRAGCNVGSVATANTILENIATDIPTVFGAGSVQAQEVKNNPGQAFADFVGIGIHCAAGDALCSSANTGEQDLLPDEPGGYAGYNALYGNKYVAPQISPNGPMTDLNGNVIQDPQGHIGFPGFDGMAAAVSLAYVATMQEHGVPITYAYISDAHDSHSGGGAFGPGAAGYVAALKAYDDAFNKFFTRLAADGITHDNTLFIFTSDEGDHFAGGPPSPANCDGVTVPCTYAKIGEINGNLAGLLATEQGITTPFKVHSDDAPTIYITGDPVRTDPVARNFARALDGLTAVSPITGNTDKISQFLADAVEMKILHMVTADPARTPSLVMFGDPDYFLFAGAPNCNSPCVTENPGFAWNHGDVQPEIVTTWLGMVGPGVGDDGVDGETWSDHTDIRPTIMLLTGLKDDYGHDGRVLSEELAGSALPSSMRGNGNIFRKLAQSYKQINACVGQFGLGTLRMSNSALSSNDPGDATYNQLENTLANLNAQRDSLASQMIQILEDAAFNGKTIDRAQASSLIQQANQLLQQVPQ